MKLDEKISERYWHGQRAVQERRKRWLKKQDSFYFDNFVACAEEVLPGSTDVKG